DGIFLSRAAASCALASKLRPQLTAAYWQSHRAAAVAALRTKTPPGWTIGADDISRDEQPVLSGTLRGEAVVLKLVFQELDLPHWRSIMAAAATAAGDVARSPLILPLDITELPMPWLRRTQAGDEAVRWPLV